jgi:hypothetical protein
VCVAFQFVAKVHGDLSGRIREDWRQETVVECEEGGNRKGGENGQIERANWSQEEIFPKCSLFEHPPAQVYLPFRSELFDALLLNQEIANFANSKSIKMHKIWKIIKG